MADLMCKDDSSDTKGNVSLRPRVSRFGSSATPSKFPALGLPQIDLVKLFVLASAGSKEEVKQCRAPHPVLQYIIDEMRRNAQSDEIREIRELNEARFFQDAYKEREKHGILWQIFIWPGYLDAMQDADLSARLAANTRFACLVADARAGRLTACGKWDHKPIIRNSKGWGVSQLVDFNPIGHDLQIAFYYDIWSNIHYGFVGKAAGFSSKHLLDSASTENKLSNLGGSEPVSDKVSIQIGLDLYGQHGVDIDLQKLLRELYDHRHSLHRYNPNLPADKRVYTK